LLKKRGFGASFDNRSNTVNGLAYLQSGTMIIRLMAPGGLTLDPAANFYWWFIIYITVLYEGEAVVAFMY